MAVPAAPRPTTAFFLLAFAITWGLQLPGVLIQQGLLPGDPAHFLPLAGLGIFGPLAAAVILTQREGGWPAVRALFARLLLWRVHPKWYLAALAPAVLLTLFLWLLQLAGRSGPIAFLPGAGAVAAGVVISVAEEIGWRGFALPRLRERWGAFTASGMLGTLWTLWHLPMFVGQGVPMNLVPLMLLLFCGASLLLTRIDGGTNGSLLLASLGHLAAHLNNSHRALPADVTPALVHTIVYAALGLYVVRPKSPLRSRAASSHSEGHSR